MTDFDVPVLESAELRVRAALESGLVHLFLVGTADSRSSTDLDAFLADIHTRLQAMSAAEVVIDFRELEFMNSSCFKAFVTWISAVQDLPEAARYKLRLRSNAKMHWQRRSLGALSSFGTETVRLET